MTASRTSLPHRRHSETSNIVFANIAVSVGFGYYPDGRIGEVFLGTHKAGTPVDIAARDTAVLMSLLLQYGCSAKIIGRALTADDRGRPEGLAGIVARMIEQEASDE